MGENFNNNEFYLGSTYDIHTSHKSVRLTGKLLKIKFKLILILFTFFVQYVFFLVQNVVGKIDKETLRIEFKIDPTFLFKKITNKVFIIG